MGLRQAPASPAPVEDPSPVGQDGRRLLVGGGWTLAGRLCSGAAGLLVVAVLSRLLDPEDFGTYLLGFSVVSVGGLLGTLGLHLVVVRAVAAGVGAGRADLAWAAAWSCVRLAAVGAAAAGGTYLLIGNLLARSVFHSAQLASIAALLAAWIGALTAQTMVTETCRGFGDLRAAAVVGGPLSAALLLVGLGVVAVAGARLEVGDGVALAAGATLASAAVGAWSLWRRFRRTALPGGRLGHRPPATPLLWAGGPLLVTSALLFLLTWADVWVVAALLPESEVAHYGAAARVAGLLGLPLLVANGALAPSIADLHARGELARLQRLLRGAATMAALPTLLALALLAWAGAPVLRLLYGEPYAASAGVLAVLGLAQACHVLGGCAVLVLALSGHQRQLAVTTAAGGLLTGAMLVAGTRALGPIGAAVAFAAGAAVQNVLWVAAARRLGGVWTVASVTQARAALRALTRQTGRGDGLGRGDSR